MIMLWQIKEIKGIDQESKCWMSMWLMLSGALSKESKDMSMQVKEANIKLIIPLLREKEKALGVVKKNNLKHF